MRKFFVSRTIDHHLECLSGPLEWSRHHKDALIFETEEEAKKALVQVAGKRPVGNTYGMYPTVQWIES